MQALKIEGPLKPLIATVTFPANTLLKIRVYRIIDSHREIFRTMSVIDDVPMHTFIAVIARRKVEMILEHGGKVPRGETSYEDEGTQYCRCRLSNLREVNEWIEKAKQGNAFESWDTTKWSTVLRFSKKSGELQVWVYGQTYRKKKPYA